MSKFVELLSQPWEEPVRSSYQAKSAEDLFEEIPVPLDVFIRDKRYLGERNLQLSALQADPIMHIERVLFPETYPLLAVHESYWSIPIRLTNYHAIQWGKGSVHKNTEVYNAVDGTWVKLKNLKSTLVASAYKENGKIFKSACTDSFYEGHGSMFRVTTKKGHHVDVWEGHRFLTWGRERYSGGKKVSFLASGTPKWTELKYLRIGDHLAMSSYLPAPVKTLDVDLREVELVGLWIGDGCMPDSRAKGAVSLAVGYKSPRVRERYESIGRSYGLGTTVQDDPHHNKVTVTLINGPRGRVVNPVREICFKYKLDGKKAATKRIPEEFFKLSTNNIALLLSRLIDTDGWITDKCNTCEIGYGTISKGLAEDIHKLLLRVGVIAELKEKKTEYNGAPYVSYQLRVRDAESVERLASQLTLLDKEEVRLRVLEKVSQINVRHSTHGDLVWDQISSIEYLGEDDYWTTTVEGPSSYVSAGGFFHHNSGKDMVCRVASLRVAYILSCLKSPQGYFGMPEDDTIHTLNVAQSATQAQEAFFDPLKRHAKRGWFNDKCSVTAQSITFEKNIELISGHSQAESQEGKNLILGICDEISGFKTKAELSRFRGSNSRESSKSAEYIMDMMETSATSRFPDTFKIVYISFPRFKGDMIQMLTKEAKRDIEEFGDDSAHFVSGPHATWVVNPLRKKSDFRKQYRKKPAESKAKFECDPTFAADPYFKNDIALDSCFIKTAVPPVHVDYRFDGKAWTPVYTYSEDFYPVQGAIYSMHADLAIKGDRAGIALSHVQSYEEQERIVVDEHGVEHTRVDKLPRVKVDFVICYEADITSTPAREIQIKWARDFCFELIRKGFNIRQCSYDGFASAESRQELESRGISSPLISTDRSEEPWKTLRDLFYNETDRFTVPYDELLRTELLGLSKKENGKVDHQAIGSKDMADALACSIVGSIMLGGQESLTGARAYYSPPEFTLISSPVDKPLGFEPDLLRWDAVVTDAYDFQTGISSWFDSPMS